MTNAFTVVCEQCGALGHYSYDDDTHIDIAKEKIVMGVVVPYRTWRNALSSALDGCVQHFTSAEAPKHQCSVVHTLLSDNLTARLAAC